ncbi:MAG: prolipoprotein diacylglyceryl transferase [Candidatus Rifleibacteriota bacterium]
MYPILLELGPIKIGSYGVTLAIAFLSAFFLINWQFRKNNCDVELAWDLHFLAIFGGMTGSRLLFIFENFSDFLKNPLAMIFSTTGFSVLGGYVLAIILCVFRVLYARQPFFRIADIYVPGMALGYAIGRLGCIFAGDGCYGIPCTYPWAMKFPNGLVSTLAAKNPMLVSLWIKMFPGTAIPEDIPVHPTPLYESVSCFMLLGILLLPIWKPGSGRRFSFFLVWFGISRYLVESIRLNPRVYWGMSSSQVISLVFIALGVMIAGASHWRKLDHDVAESDHRDNK